jgi:hypothetical protein
VKNCIWLRIFVSVMILGIAKLALCMDMSSSLAQFPRELQSHILALYNTDLDQEARIAQLVILKKVCASWRTILTDRRIADIVGIPHQPDALRGALARAAREKHLKTMELICRAYPSVDMRQALYVVLKKQAETGMFPDEELEILLDYGLNPNATHVDSVDISLGGGDFYITEDALLTCVLG